MKTGIKRALIVFATAWLLLAVGLAWPGLNPQPAFSAEARPDFARARITVSNADGRVHSLKVEMARTAHEHAYGLMFLTGMPDTDGMLFVNARPVESSFWMKNTLMALDIIFIDAQGRVLNIHERAAPHSLTHRSSQGPAAMVLELAGGHAAELGIAPGSAVTVTVTR